MRCRWRAPKATQEPGDDQILLGLRQRTERCPWFAALKQHGGDIIVSIEKPYRWITAPEAQALDFVLALHVRHAELQHCGCPVGERHRSNPGTTSLVEWSLQLE